MNHPVLIKGNKYGIRLVLDKDMAFDELSEHIGQRFVEAEKFFKGNVNMALTIEGRVLSNEEVDKVLSIISEQTGLTISCVIDENSSKDTMNFIPGSVPEKVSERADENVAVDIAEPVKQTQVLEEPAPVISPPRMVYENRETILYNDSMFYKGTLRSGQLLESEGSIVVLGDVNPGASIVSAGNIIVIGRLKGVAHAGASGNIHAFVMALSMNPMQIRIGDAIARSADKPKRKVDDEAKIAFVEDGNIYIEPVKKSVLNDIHL